MFNFLKIQYQLGRISASQLYSLIGKKITEVEYEMIVNPDKLITK
jgi:hypothetical protein